MLAKNMSNVLPVIGMVLFLVILSMMAISYFGVNMNMTDGVRNLNRSATFEGLLNKKKQNSETTEEAAPRVPEPRHMAGSTP